MWRVAAALLSLLLAAATSLAQTVEYYELDHLGSVRVVTNDAGTVIRTHDFLPFGQEYPAAVSWLDKQLFTGQERDDESGLDYFGARYYRADLGRFTTVDPAMTLEENLADPQRWNRYAHARNNPLKYVDPDGREVRPVGALALDRIQSTVPHALRASIAVGENGMLNRDLLNSVTTGDPNFLALRTMANESGVVEVRTASGVTVEGGKWEPFDYTTTEAMKAEVARFGGDPKQVTQGFSFLGYTTATGVVLSDGSGRAQTAPAVELAVTTAHELYGHALPRLQGRPWKHEFTAPTGPVDRQILEIESRTRKIYQH